LADDDKHIIENLAMIRAGISVWKLEPPSTLL
jgi:hypothetical protein